MKLLYLYVETLPERGITKKNPIEVNFDCGYKFRYDREINKLSCKRGQDLPKGFFSLSAEEGCVDSVSVIIGDNGSRKTTIAATFGRLFQQERHLPEYICIYKQGARLIIYYHFEDGTMPLYSSIEGTWINAEDDTEYADVAIHNRPFDILYYSPYFTNNEIWSGEVMADKVDNVNLPLHDISTTYLMSHPKTSDKDIDRINAFRFEEQERILRFAHEYVNTFGKLKREAGKSVTKNDEHGPVLPPPIYAQFIVDTSTVVQFMESPLAGRIPEVRDVVCNQDCHNPVWQLVSKILVCILRAQIDDKHSEQVYRYKRILIEICGKIQKAAQQTANKDRFQEFSDYVKRLSGVEALKAVLKPMVKVYGNSVLRRPREGYVLWGQVDIADKDDFDDVIDVKRHMPRLESWLARAIGRHETLMNVELANMSSGEMAYWTLFARLYDVFRNKMPKNDRRDILLFLDEAETTLHPVWQQQLVRNVIWFLEKFVNEKTRGDATMRRVHVIFATHSPGPFNCGSPGQCCQNPRERPFSRSYGSILPSSLTWFLSRTLVCSTHPPVSVCGTVPGTVDFRKLFLAAWSRRLRRGSLPRPASRIRPKPCPLALPRPTGSAPYLPRHSRTRSGSPGMFAWRPSATRFRLALGTD